MKLCTAGQMRSIDSRAVSEYGIPSLLLMENAGRSVAERALAMLEKDGWAPGEPVVVWVLCGKGSNGGDGLAAARHLQNHGVSVLCSLAAEREEYQGDARTNLELAEKAGAYVRPIEETRPLCGLIIDALLGTGSRGEPRGKVAEGIQSIRDAVSHDDVPVLAVDLPSGLDSDTGRPAALHVSATETVTLGLPKPGLALYPGRELAGGLSVANISLPRRLLNEDALSTEWITAETAAPLWPAREVTAHKGDSGRLFVLAGSPGLTGAAAMACESALRAGAGLVTLGIPRSLGDAMAARLTEAMWLPLPETAGRAHSPESLTPVRERLAGGGALAAGPGFGRDPKSGELLRALLAGCPAPVVVDADGLTLLSPADERTFPPNCVITPHPGEMARLLGTEIPEIQSNRLETARQAAARFGCVVVLKGAGSVIAAPDGRAAINSSGGPALATGGTGDVLTGVIGACLARGLPPYEAAAAGVFLHGAAGDAAGERTGAPGSIAGDVIAAIPEALRRLRMGEIELPYRMM